MRAAVRELAMRAIGLAPRVDSAMIASRSSASSLYAGRSPAGAILEAAGFAALPPAPRAALGKLEVATGTAMLPARGGRLVDELE
jgi:hypothetical protein